MSEEIAALLRKYEANLNKESEEKVTQKATEQAFLEEFVGVRDEIIRPRFEAYKAHIESAGHIAAIHVQDILEAAPPIGRPPPIIPSISFCISMKRKNIAPSANPNANHPHIIFDAVPREKMARCRSSTSADGHGGSSSYHGSFALGDVTPAAVDKSFEAWFGRLVREALA